MVEKSDLRSGETALRPRARIIQNIGEELISSEIVAITELVKNSYDADATRVLIRFTDPLETNKGEIEIIDNGHGMTIETLLNSWMQPATPHKKREPLTELGRRVAGEKGIGRFATSRLGKDLTLISRYKQSEYELLAYFDWRLFDDEETFLDEVEILWETQLASELSPNSLPSLENSDNQLDNVLKKANQGTILKINALQKIWKLSDIAELNNALSRLVSHNFFNAELYSDDFKISLDRTSKNNDFKIFLDLPERFIRYNGIVSPPDILKNPHYHLKGVVKNNARYSFELEIEGKKQVQMGKFENVPSNINNSSNITACGQFEIDLRVWDRDKLADLADLYGKKTKDIREDLNNASGIKIYRDFIRVLPFGEGDDDWLDLNFRRVQEPTHRISRNQIVGQISITAEENNELIDQSNREGLKSNDAFNDLKMLVLSTLRILETERYKVRPRQEKAKRAGGVFDGFDFKKLQDYLSDKYSSDRELMSLIDETKTDLNQRVEIVQESLARYRRLATLGNLVDKLLHDGRTPLAKIGNHSNTIKHIVESNNQNDCTKILNSINKRVNYIHQNRDILYELFQRIEPFGERKKGRPKSVVLEQIIADAFILFEKEIKDNNINIALPASETNVTVVQSEIQRVIMNLLENSIYWLKHQDKNDRRIEITLNRVENDELNIYFSDNGPGIMPSDREFIFDPYFSKKIDGYGLGLSIAGEILDDYYDGELVLLDEGDLKGANFLIILRKRV